MELISIIIPVYNTGKYLERCIYSIIHQSYNDLDIIIVDDGSELATAQICDTLAASDFRIRVFHKNNEGVSVARNYGLRHAKGQYIGFVDSDDWIHCNMYSTMYSKMDRSKADIIYCDAFTVYDNHEDKYDTFENLINSMEIPRWKISPQMLTEMAGSVWRGLYRREVLEGVEFTVGLKLSEDRFFNLQALSKSDKIYYLKEAFYYRYMREDSCVNSFHPDALQVTCRGFDLIAEYAGIHWGKEFYDEYRRKQLASFSGLFYGALHCGKGLRRSYREIKSIASSPVLFKLIKLYSTSDMRLLLAYYKCYSLLFILIYIHGRIKRY